MTLVIRNRPIGFLPEFDRDAIEARFAPFADQPMLEPGVYYFPEVRMADLDPVLVLKPTERALEQLQDLGIDDTIASVLVKDRGRRKNAVAWSGGLREIGSGDGVEITIGEHLERGLRGALDVLCVVTNIEPFEWSGFTVPAKSVLWEARFGVQPEREAVEFPVRFVEPDALERSGYPRDTAWVCHFKTSDPNAAPSDVMEVWINKRLDGPIQSLASDPRFGKALLTHMVCAAFATASRWAVQEEVDVVEEEGLLDVILKRLSMHGSELDEAALRRLAVEDAGVRLDATVQARFGLLQRLGGRAE